MGWYKRGWEAGMATLEEWWRWSVLYHYNEGISPLEMPPNYVHWTHELVEFVRDIAKQDPTPIHRVGRLIDDHAGLSPKIGEPRATLRDIEFALDDAVILKDYLLNVGITDVQPEQPKKRGRRKGASSKNAKRPGIVKEIKAGGFDSNIADHMSVTKDYVGKIRRELKAQDDPIEAPRRRK